MIRLLIFSHITAKRCWKIRCPSLSRTSPGIFADDGISGTNTKKRDEFNRMIDECMAGNIDMVITKSISRFARNTLDCLKYIRQLKEKNIAVWFEKESINTMDSKGEVLITIMASLARQESQSLSQNLKLRLQYRYQQGKVQVNHNHFLGYTKDGDGHLVIDPEQAEVVKRIYRRVQWNNLGCKSIVWRCISRLEPSRAVMNCTSRTVKEDLLQEVTVKAFNRILTDSDGFLRQMQENIAKAIIAADTMSPDGIQARLDELQDFIGSQQSEITEFDEILVRKLIQQITVYDDHFTVRFKSGLKVDINE